MLLKSRVARERRVRACNRFPMHFLPVTLSLPKTRFVRIGDAIRPRLHGRRCPRSARSGCVYRISDSAWTQRIDGVSSRPDEGSAQADSRRPGFALQVESKAGSRNPDPTATDQCASPAGTETTAPQQYRSFSVWLYHWFPAVVSAIAIVRPETIIRWHRAGFRAYWHWRSRNHVGRPKVSA